MRSRGASAPAHTPLEARASGKVARVAPPARIPANERAVPRARRHVAMRPRGSGSPASCRIASSMISCPTFGAAVRADRLPRPRCAPSRRRLCRASPASRLRRSAGACATARSRRRVAGTREPQALDRIAADVVVIDAERIRDSSADSVEDLLRREAGMQLSRNGGPGQSAAVFIRGAARQQHRACWSTACASARPRSARPSSRRSAWRRSSASRCCAARPRASTAPTRSAAWCRSSRGAARARRASARMRPSAATARATPMRRRAVRTAPLDYARVAVARAQPTASRRCGRTILFGNFNPDRDGYARASGAAALRLHAGARPPHRRRAWSRRG